MFKRNALGTIQYIYSYGTTADPRWGLYFLGTNFLRFVADDGVTAAAASSNIQIADSDWHLIGFSWDRSEADGLHFFLDGAEVGSGYNMSTVNGSLDHASVGVGIGCRFTPSGSNCFSGDVDETSLWKGVVLSEAEHNEIYNGGYPANLGNHSQYDNLSAWWNLGENGTWDGSDWAFPE